MKNIFRLFCFLAGSAAALHAQSAAAPSNVANFLPAYYVGTGATFDYYGKTGFAANTEIGIQIKGGPVYSYSTLELTSTTATLRTGALYVFDQSGNFSLGALGDAGLATGQGPTLGAFSGGLMVFYDIGARVTKGVQHFYIGAGARVLQLSGQAVQPIASVTFGKGF